MNAAQFLIDTSALARFMHSDAERHGWDQAAAAGRPQRGQAQPRSRSWTARRMLAGMESEYPMSSGSDGVL